jgi:hypothetical protein
MTANESIRGYGPGQDRSIDPADEPTYYTHNKTPTACVCTPADVDAVYAALVRHVDDGNQYVRSSDLDSGLSLSKPEIGTALRELSKADDCPLDVSQWGGDSTTPILYRVRRADQ